MIATITLNPSIDQHLDVYNLVKDDANRAKKIVSYPGGKGLNVSKVVHELGGPTCAYAIAGGFVGNLWEALVKDLEVPYSLDRVKGEMRINTILTDLKDRTQTRVSAPGPHVPLTEVTSFLKRLLTVKPRPFMWALGGSLSRGMEPSTYAQFVSALQKTGVPCILDADGDALKHGIEAKPFLIKPNEYEITRLCGRRLVSRADYAKAARSIVKRGVRIVVVSLGASGALVVSAEEAFHVEGIQVPVKSKVGAGDSVIGGLAFGLYRHLPLRQAAALGIAASASAVMREAPRLCRKADIPRLLRRVKINPLR